jgi:hypothetical protein
LKNIRKCPFDLCAFKGVTQFSSAASSKLAKTYHVMLINHVEYPILKGLLIERVAEGKSFDLHDFSWVYIMQFSNFFCMFLNPNNFFPICILIVLIYMKNLQEQVKKAFCYQKLFWPFTIRINCSSALNFFSWLLQQFSHSKSEQFW